MEQAENKSSFCGIIGGSEVMQRVYQAIQAVADSTTTVMLRGESGTGKELVAAAIAQTGNRRDKPYVCVNCSAIPENLIESELFGHERGSFTGADTAKPGLIETAQDGTLFLDEITTLDHGLQSKLLRVLQEHTVQRIGGRIAKKIDFRLIAASNDNLEELVKQGRFREDKPLTRAFSFKVYIPPVGDMVVVAVTGGVNFHPLSFLVVSGKKVPGSETVERGSIDDVVFSPDGKHYAAQSAET